MAKMQLNKSLVIMFCILRLTFAAENVKTCKEENVKNEICLKSLNGRNATYTDPFPLALNTTMNLKEIIEIDEKESSITVRVLLSTTWIDPGLGLSNGTTG